MCFCRSRILSNRRRTSCGRGAGGGGRAGRGGEGTGFGTGSESDRESGQAIPDLPLVLFASLPVPAVSAAARTTLSCRGWTVKRRRHGDRGGVRVRGR